MQYVIHHLGKITFVDVNINKIIKSLFEMQNMIKALSSHH